MIRRLLIANRGEIAVRIARTARDMGVETVAVHSDVDAGALHVQVCDQAVPLGGARPEDSYLRGDAIVAAALAAGADAIHPGYGFLSENARFAEAVEAAGLIWVGPPAQAIRDMGDKAAAKAIMAAAGVPVVPGYHGADQSDARLTTEAEATGFPLLIKAVAGGGGKGMRAVQSPDEFPAALASARAEAQSAFGNADVLLERLIETPRHIEVQIFGDGTRAVHLYERDCSLQRRHQKVIEEAPAPGITDNFRAAVTGAAVRAAEAVGYRGAGTVEFIAGADLDPKNVFFMEMNTRLQVEHPVTEAITGVDLVRWQLGVAGGAPLPLGQADIQIQGHAFEARLYAEDVPAGFLPATGTLSHLRWPARARIDTGIRAGDTVSPFYDPMVAKIITHADTRDAALADLKTALAELQVAGLTTNQGFLSRLASDAEFQTGQVDTGLIARKDIALCAAPTPDAADWAMAAAAAMGLTEPPVTGQGFSLWKPLSWTVTLDHRGQGQQVTLTPFPDGTATAETPEGPARIACWPEQWKVSGTARQRMHAARNGDEVTLFGTDPITFFVPDPLSRGKATLGGDHVLAPMPGLVTTLFARPGDTVTEGQPLATMEAMKMEHTLRAPRDGTIANVLAAAGAQVDAGATLISLEPPEDGKNG